MYDADIRTGMNLRQDHLLNFRSLAQENHYITAPMSWNKRSPAAFVEKIAPVIDARNAINDVTLHVLIFMISVVISYGR
jgi:hypothetical protein